MTASTDVTRPPGKIEGVDSTRHHAPTPPAPTSTLPTHTARLTWDQFLLSQLSLATAVALIVGLVTFATVRALPAGANLPGRQLSSQTAATDGTISAFTAGTVAQQVQVAADPGGTPKWDKVGYEAQAGDVTFVVTNASPMMHNFAVEGPGVLAQSPNFAGKTTNSFTLKGLRPGEYLIVCTFAGHREAGMIAKLTVR